MGRGKTLWEMLVDKVQGPVERRHYNPLNARVGGGLMINDLDLRDYQFFIREIRAYEREVAGRPYPFVDYVALARPLGGDDVLVRLRLIPTDDPDPGRPSHHVVVLHLYDEFAHDPAFYGVVTDTTRKFEVVEDGQPAEEYWRINDVTDPYRARVTVLKDDDGSGAVDRDEVEAVPLLYWDYWREVTNEAGLPVRQFLFVEMNQGDGWFQLWRGTEVDAQQVIAL